jgi:hypothetical protein
MVLAEQHDEWTESRRYLCLDVLARARLTLAGSVANRVHVRRIDHRSPGPS